MPFHLDTDFLVYALAGAGPERQRLLQLADSSESLGMSSVAWYEFARGPRTPEQLAVAQSFLGTDGIIPFDEELASRAAEVFRALGAPRKRSGDIAIAITAVAHDATLLSRNGRDFARIPGLKLEALGG
jgi:tRNA(fMet)-specific endonuclease VapC